MKYPEVLKYNLPLYAREDSRLLQDIIFENKNDINNLLRDIEEGTEKIIDPNINIIRKNLKKKSKKFIVSNNFNIGNLYTFGANIEETNVQRIFAVPFKGNSKAMIRFRLFKRSKYIKTSFNRLIMAFKTSKVRVTIEEINIKKINYIKFNVDNELDNEKFWSIIKLWSKN